MLFFTTNNAHFWHFYLRSNLLIYMFFYLKKGGELSSGIFPGYSMLKAIEIHLKFH